ncbi:hypothetical protein HDZ31DRAFT_37858 [Schizophyllum fasciatum]
MHDAEGPPYAFSRQGTESATQIINRFEGTYDTTPRSLQNRTLQTPDKPHRSTFMDNYKNKKDRSPLRRSFQNFMSVLKKSPAAFKKRAEPEPAAPLITKASSVSTHATPTSNVRPPSASSGYARHAGQLLYLCHAENECRDVFPVWTSCSVSLEGSALLATWYTAMGNPFTQVIDLTCCTDICALSVDQLEPAFQDMLPNCDDGSDPRIFEIIFDGQPSHCFGASSVKARARWISAIWCVCTSFDGTSYRTNE